jgi:transposase-like protein
MISTIVSDRPSVTPAGVMSKLPVTVDTKGRVRTTKEQRRTILAEFERSGLSAAQFAQRAGVKYSTLAAWVQRYRRTKRPGPKSTLRLLEAVVTPTALTTALQVHLPAVRDWTSVKSAKSHSSRRWFAPWRSRVEFFW